MDRFILLHIQAVYKNCFSYILLYNDIYNWNSTFQNPNKFHFLIKGDSDLDILCFTAAMRCCTVSNNWSKALELMVYLKFEFLNLWHFNNKSQANIQATSAFQAISAWFRRVDIFIDWFTQVNQMNFALNSYSWFVKQ